MSSFTHDPIITKKIYYIKGLLKEYAVYSKSIKAYYKHNDLIISKYILEKQKEGKIVGSWEAHRDPSIKDILKPYPISPATFLTYLTITPLHIYYLKVKGSTKTHTKDDKKYENDVYYKITVEKLEKEFALSLEAGKEGISHG